MKKICMIVPNPGVKGGIAAVVNGYRGSRLEQAYDVTYIESYTDGGKLKKLVKAISGCFRYTLHLAARKPDVVHIHASFGPSFYRKLPFILLARLFRVPVINHIHGSAFETFYTEATAVKKKLVRSVYNGCTAIVALSEEWRRKLRRIVPDEKIRVIGNYAIPRDGTPRARRPGTRGGRVLFLGAISRDKGCFDMPAVIEKVAAELPDTRFIIAGAGDINTVRLLLRERGVEKNAEFPGWVRDSRKEMLLRECDVFFLPSYSEAMPMSVLEAMGCGLPVVSTEVGGIPQLVVHNRSGLLYKPGDIDGMSRGLLALLGSRERAAQFGAAGLEIVRERFSLERHLMSLARLYEEVTAEKSGSMGYEYIN